MPCAETPCTETRGPPWAGIPEGEITMTIAILLALELICLTCLQDSRHDTILAAELGLDSLDG